MVKLGTTFPCPPLASGQKQACSPKRSWGWDKGRRTTSLQFSLFFRSRADEPVSDTDSFSLVDTSAKETEAEGTSAQP